MVSAVVRFCCTCNVAVWWVFKPVMLCAVCVVRFTPQKLKGKVSVMEVRVFQSDPVTPTLPLALLVCFFMLPYHNSLMMYKLRQVCNHLPPHLP